MLTTTVAPGATARENPSTPWVSCTPAGTEAGSGGGDDVTLLRVEPAGPAAVTVPPPAAGSVATLCWDTSIVPSPLRSAPTSAVMSIVRSWGVVAPLVTVTDTGLACPTTAPLSGSTANAASE